MNNKERIALIKEVHDKAMNQRVFTTSAHPNDVAWLIEQAERAEKNAEDLHDMDMQLHKTQMNMEELKDMNVMANEIIDGLREDNRALQEELERLKNK